MIYSNHWYTLHLSDFMNDEHIELLERHRLEREVVITKSQINRMTSHLAELKAKLKKLEETLQPQVSEKSDESKTVGG